MPVAKPKNSQFTIESWNHKCFDPDYHMVWGPYPIEAFDKEVITGNLSKFDPNVKFIKYKHIDVTTRNK